MIGGATTSMLHTAVKLQPAYSHPVVHVKDASLSVGAASALLACDPVFLEKLQEEYRALRNHHERSTAAAQPLSLSDARANRLQIDWTAEPPATPVMTGIHRWNDYPLDEIRKHINWTYFFLVWQLKGKYPQILEHPEHGAEARKLFDDANRLLDALIQNKRIVANAVFGIFPANSAGDDITVYADENRAQALCTFCNLRSQTAQKPNLCLSDFIAPRESGIKDYIGAFAVTAGLGVDAAAKEYEAAGDDYSVIMLKALADRLAEAFAELLHRELLRQYWGIEEQRGIRVSHGYPACPDHSEKATLFELLQARESGLNLTETFAMTPAASVSGLIFAHPKSRHFSVGEISEEQERDYGRRKGDFI